MFFVVVFKLGIQVEEMFIKVGNRISVGGFADVHVCATEFIDDEKENEETNWCYKLFPFQKKNKLFIWFVKYKNLKLTQKLLTMKLLCSKVWRFLLLCKHIWNTLSVTQICLCSVCMCMFVLYL